MTVDDFVVHSYRYSASCLQCASISLAVAFSGRVGGSSFLNTSSSASLSILYFGGSCGAGVLKSASYVISRWSENRSSGCTSHDWIAHCFVMVKSMIYWNVLPNLLKTLVGSLLLQMVNALSLTNASRCTPLPLVFWPVISDVVQLRSPPTIVGMLFAAIAMEHASKHPCRSPAGGLYTLMIRWP